MKTALFIIALIFNIGLCCLPFQDLQPENEPSQRSVRSSGEKPTNTAPVGLAYSELLKNKAKHLANH